MHSWRRKRRRNCWNISCKQRLSHKLEIVHSFTGTRFFSVLLFWTEAGLLALFFPFLVLSHFCLETSVSYSSLICDSTARLYSSKSGVFLPSFLTKFSESNDVLQKLEHTFSRPLGLLFWISLNCVFLPAQSHFFCQLFSHFWLRWFVRCFHSLLMLVFIC